MTVLQFPMEEIEVMQCMGCDSTRFTLLANEGVPICCKCDTPMPIILCPMPGWLVAKVSE